MKISNAHNLHEPPIETRDGTFGIRVTVPPEDPFSRLVDEDWSTTHWYRTAAERDAALREMARRHEYSRPNDLPTLKFEKIERSGNT